MSSSSRDKVEISDFGDEVDKSIQLPKGYLSPSAIDTFLKCPKKYEFYYLHNIPTPSTPALAKGLAVHAGIELYYLSKMDNKELRVDDVVEYSVDSLQKNIKEKEISVSTTEYNSMESNVKQASSLYVEHIGRHTTPKKVESELKCVIAGVPIVGYTDLIREMTDEEKSVQSYLLAQGSITPEQALNELVIADNKTSAKKWMKSNLENSIQLVLYSIGTGIIKQEIHNIVWGRDTSLHVLSHMCSDEQIIHVTNIVRDVGRAISSGVFPRCAPGNWWCTEKFCPYYKLCRTP